LVKLSREAGIMAGLLVVYVIADFLLTPLGGLETRPVSQVTTLGVATLGLLFTGLALNIICLVLLLRHHKRAPIFGIIGSLLYFPAAIADQTGMFSSLSPPTAITYVELVEAIIAIATITMGALLFRKKLEAQTKPT
jgi:hypothetical protein